MTSRRPGFGVLRAAVALGVACLLPASASAQERYTRAEENDFHRAAHPGAGPRRPRRGARPGRGPGRRGPLAAALLARLDILRGEYEAAEERLAPVAAANPIGAAGLELALLHQYLGRRDEAAARLRVLVDRLQRSPDAVDLYRAARAARALGRYRQANALLRNAAGAAPDDPAIETLWGDLFGERSTIRPRPRSPTSPRWSSTRTGRRRCWGWPAPSPTRTLRKRARRRARAIEIDSRLPDAHLFLAQRSLDDRDHEAGQASLDRALAVNERSLEARSLVAAVAYVEDRLDDFEVEVERVLEINPTYGEVYRVAGNLTARNYRFEEAAALVRRGWRSTPRTPAATPSSACTCCAPATSRGRGGPWSGRSRRIRTTSSRSTCWRCSTPSTSSRPSRRET